MIDVEENKTNAFLTTDTDLEAVVSLAMVSETLPKVTKVSHYWKWVIIAMHNALQGYMVLALRGTCGLNVLDKKCREELIAARKRGSKDLPNLRLDGFMDLYQKIKRDKQMLLYTNSKSFRPRGSQTESVKSLNRLRNDFIHFLPKCLSVQVDGLPRVIKDCSDIVEFLAFECGNVVWYEEENKSKTGKLIATIRTNLSELNNLYSS